ncbi:hypothetical protein HDU93_002685 [Gonapodya sp. JEL0774]|nr:hypothetical protein HDU93_002685 [Gonapodya sp. JEL0774]
MAQLGRTDNDLIQILKTVYLEYLVDREGGFEIIKEWKDVFSGGEKQRIQLARLFYHRPRWIVLDDATAAVSTDVEGLLYNSFKDLGVTIISISHRPALLKHHNWLLRIGEGEDGTEWILESLQTPDHVIESIDMEIKRIQEQLGDVPDLKRRLAEINKELRLEMAPSEGDLKHAKRTLV